MAYGISYYNNIKCFSKYSNRINIENSMKYIDMVGLKNFAQIEAKNLSLVNQRRIQLSTLYNISYK